MAAVIAGIEMWKCFVTYGKTCPIMLTVTDPAVQTACDYVLTPAIVHQILQYNHHAYTSSTFLGNTNRCSEMCEMQATTLPSIPIPITCKSDTIVIVGTHQEVVSA